MDPRPRVVLHADMDAFYASIEQRDRPELRGRPLIVGGPPPRGVVAAASYEVRPFGVHSAMPTVEALRRCPDAVVLGGDMKKYARESRRIRAIFDAFSPDVEPLSLDEAFLDLTDCMRALGGTPREIAQRLKDRVRAETGLAVSIGIAPVKMAAKIASDLSKPDGLLEVAPDGVPAFLAPLPIGRLWGVGPVTEADLRGLGLATIGDLASLDLAALARERSVSGPLLASLARLQHLARGEDERSVDADRDALSYGEENTFARDVSERATLRDAIVQHAEAVARRLRTDRVAGDVVRLKAKSTERLAQPGKYRLYTRQTTLAAPTDDGGAIARAALALLDRGGLPRPLRLIGVAVAGIRPAAASIGEQMSLFDRSRRELNRALDAIVGRWGTGAIRRGAGGAEKASPTLGVKRGE
ncbi:MAG TPA: DNA polymerase IV [Candidatus Binatia bacterium]|nr:DNA polymerase IV [Candidatus Binatia bacterium]